MTVLPTPRAQLAIVILLFGMELLLIFMATTFWIIGLEKLAYLGEVIVVKLDLERLPYVKHWLKVGVILQVSCSSIYSYDAPIILTFRIMSTFYQLSLRNWAS